MANTADTKFQVNFKLADGTLINLYAATAQELEAQLATVQDAAALINAVSGSLANAAAIRNVTAAMPGAQIISSAPTQAPAQTVADNAYVCSHGAMQYRESKPGAPKAWKGYFCPTPKGTPNQCEPRFIRG